MTTGMRGAFRRSSPPSCAFISACSMFRATRSLSPMRSPGAKPARASNQRRLARSWPGNDSRGASSHHGPEVLDHLVGPPWSREATAGGHPASHPLPRPDMAVESAGPGPAREALQHADWIRRCLGLPPRGRVALRQDGREAAKPSEVEPGVPGREACGARAKPGRLHAPPGPWRPRPPRGSLRPAGGLLSRVSPALRARHGRDVPKPGRLAETLRRQPLGPGPRRRQELGHPRDQIAARLISGNATRSNS